MKLTRVEQLFDGSRLIFYYTAEGRVDFRELVRDLAAQFRIAHRDAADRRARRGARCSAATAPAAGRSAARRSCRSFEPVSIKMAKQQDLSLNPSKLSGLCGRLKCCLRYELPNGKGREARRLRRRRRLRILQQPDRTGRGGGGCGTCGSRRLRNAAGDEAAAHRHHRRRSRRHRAGDRAQGGGAIPAFSRCASSCSTARRRDATLARVRARPRVGGSRAAPPTTPSSRAVADAQADAIDAIATAPINKEAFAAAGLPWRGHTDLLAHLTGAPRVAMMFYADALRVVLATVHIPLAEVPRALTARDARRHDRADRRASCRASASPSPRLARRRAQPARRRARR